LILDPQKVRNKVNLDFDILSGSVDELNINVFILEKKLHLTVEGVELNVFIPLNNLKKFIVKKHFKETTDLNHFLNNIQNKNLNPLFGLLNNFTNLSITVRNIKVNAYFEFEEKIYKFNLVVDEVSTKSKSYSDISINQIVNLKDLDISLSILQKPPKDLKSNTELEKFTSTTEKSNLEKAKMENEKACNILKKTINKLNITCFEKILQKFSIDVTLLAKNFRISQNKSVEDESEVLECNNYLDVSIPFVEINLSQKTLINLFSFAIKFEDLKNQRNQKIQHGKYTF